MTREEQERDYKIHCAAIDKADYELKHLDKLLFEVAAKADYDNGFIRGFKEGAAWADKHPKSPWISVEERLPENIFDNEVYRFVICAHDCMMYKGMCNYAYLAQGDSYLENAYDVLIWLLKKNIKI